MNSIPPVSSGGVGEKNGVCDELESAQFITGGAFPPSVERGRNLSHHNGAFLAQLNTSLVSIVKELGRMSAGMNETIAHIY